MPMMRVLPEYIQTCIISKPCMPDELSDSMASYQDLQKSDYSPEKRMEGNAVSVHILQVLEPHRRRPGYISTLFVCRGLLWVVCPQILVSCVVFFHFFVHR